MRMFRTLAISGLVATTAIPALAQRVPPQESLPLSEVLAAIESREDVAYFDEIEWDSDGYWDVEYYTPAGAEVKLRIDPVNGETIPRR